jgi:hypothetical protein
MGSANSTFAKTTGAEGSARVTGGVRQGIARVGLLELGRDAYLARPQTLGGYLFLALEVEDLPHAFLALSGGVENAGVGAQGSRVDLEERELAREGVCDGLEHIGGEGLSLGGLALDLGTVLRVRACHRPEGGHVSRGGKAEVHGLQEPVDAHVS